MEFIEVRERGTGEIRLVAIDAIEVVYDWENGACIGFGKFCIHVFQSQAAILCQISNISNKKFADFLMEEPYNGFIAIALDRIVQIVPAENGQTFINVPRAGFRKRKYGYFVGQPYYEVRKQIFELSGSEVGLNERG